MNVYALCFVFALFISLSFAQITVDTPADAATCSTIQLLWEGGVAPYSVRCAYFRFSPRFVKVNSVSVLSATGDIIQTFSPSTAPPLPWTIAFAPQSGLAVQVVDGIGTPGFSTLFDVVPSPSGLQPPPCRAVTGGTPDQGGGHTDGGGNKGGSDGAGNGNGTGNGTGDDQSGQDDGSDPPNGGGQGSANNNNSSSTTSDADTTSDLASTSSSALSSESVSIPTTTSPESTASADTPSSSQIISVSDSVPNLPPSPTTPPAIAILPTADSSAGDAEVNSTSIGVDGTQADANGATKKGFSMSHSAAVIAAIVVGSVAAVLFLIGCFIIRRRRRQRARDSVFYPFSAEGDHSSSSSRRSREMRGRAGYPASAFSSWGNHGDLAAGAGDEQAPQQGQERAVAGPDFTGPDDGVNAHANVVAWDSSQALGQQAYADAPQEQQSTYAYPGQQPYAYPQQGASTYPQPPQAYAYPQQPQAYAYAYPGEQQTQAAIPTSAPSPTLASIGFTAAQTYTVPAPAVAEPSAPVSNPSPNVIANAAGHGHGHGTSSSIDLGRSEPGSPARPGQRFRGPPKAMIEAYRAGLTGPRPPANYNLPNAYDTPNMTSPISPNVQDNVETAAMLPVPANERERRARRPVVNYPPPYTSS
ncbi:hypothetical protein MKEN_01103000 [Mycena kentingensis (nom. inval.)]|nr:hypothetical protein MKEN_01103000 [Mycena kentingensis (nom. inval.)]